MKVRDSSATFATLGLRAELTDVVSALGYEEPTPVQRETIPFLLDGRDLLGQAETLGLRVVDTSTLAVQEVADILEEEALTLLKESP